ncbi:MAG: hypothetical protein GX458_06605 [Phyllobacteriaceae bacterium]|nr:hypothetical protein [Phyllobacteriaceae bacterium]
MSGVRLVTGPDEHRPNGRPLLVVDVDEVVLRFVAPFSAFLETRGFRLHPRSYALGGNVTRAGGDQAVAGDVVQRLIGDFFFAAVDDQPAVADAIAVLERLRAVADPVLLTNVPAAQAERRAAHLGRLGLTAPMIANAGAKGPAVARLAAGARAVGGVDLPVIFVDDGPTQLASARGAVGDLRLVQFVADPVWFALAPEIPGIWLRTRLWTEVEAAITAIGADRRGGEAIAGSRTAS